MSFIRIENLTKTYREGETTRTVLHNLSITFEKGEFTAILGKSGSGKSTLLNLLSGIDRADTGKIWVGDTELTTLNERQRTLFRRRRIGFIFQFFNLIPTLTVGENILLPLELNEIPMHTARPRAETLLKTVGLTERWHTAIDKLSGGEQQRVAIARALAHNPDILLADEPTGNLDEETGKQIMALLETLVRDEGKNLLMVTHSREAASHADTILHLRDGGLIRDK